MGSCPLYVNQSLRNPTVVWIGLIVFTTFSISGIPGAVRADEGDQGLATAQFLKIDPSARSTAMGSAYSASTDGSNTAYHNPAGLSRLETNRASITHLDLFQGITYQNLSVAGPWRGESGWSLSYQGIDFGEQNRTRVGSGGSRDPVTGLGDFGADDFALNVSSGMAITDRWTIGGTAKYVKKQIAEFDDATFSGDLGTQYQLTETIRLGARARNVFGDLALEQEDDPLPRSLDIGINWKKHINQHRLVLRSRVSVPGDADEFVSWGVEWGMWETLYLRGGFNGNPEAGDGITFGGGLDVGRFTVDYSLEDLGELGDHSKFSLEYRF